MLQLYCGSHCYCCSVICCHCCCLLLLLHYILLFIPVSVHTDNNVLSHDECVFMRNRGYGEMSEFLMIITRSFFGGDTRPAPRTPEVARDVTRITLADWSIPGYRRWRASRSIFRTRHSLGNTVALAGFFAELWQIEAKMERWKDKYTLSVCGSISR